MQYFFEMIAIQEVGKSSKLRKKLSNIGVITYGEKT